MVSMIFHAKLFMLGFHLLICFFFSGCPETLALNMSKLVWSTLTTLKERHPLASEVTTLCLNLHVYVLFLNFYWENFFGIWLWI